MNAFSTFLQAHQILSDELEIAAYAADRTKSFNSKPHLVLFPETTADVSAILKHCSKKHILVIPSGGRTGLTSATVANQDEVLLSLDRMNKIISIDSVGATINVEAGAILEVVQDAVSNAGLYFPLDFAAKGSCQIGGCISTNAGGVKVIRYGMTRDLVLGLEVVLSSGEVLELNKALLKDNSGYDLKQFFIGAEGTLGVITKATFSLKNKPKNPKQVLFAIEHFQQIPELFARCKQQQFDILAFEFLDTLGVDATRTAMPQLMYPFASVPNYTVLAEFENASDDSILALLETLAELNLVQDASIAESSKMSADFWALREAVSDSLYLLGTVHANDVSVPISELTAFVTELQKIVTQNYSEFTMGLFGHIGDGNFHIYIIDKKNRPFEDMATRFHALDKNMFALVQQLGGSISAEHGIGLLKKEALHYRRSEAEIELMRKLKTVFDPQGILNPSKIF